MLLQGVSQLQMQELYHYLDFQNLKKMINKLRSILLTLFIHQMSRLTITWKIDLKVNLITWHIILLEWFMNKNLKNFGLIAKIRISKIKEEMKKKEK
jgi:hypothetical protein